MKVGDLVGKKMFLIDKRVLKISGIVININKDQDPGFEIVEVFNDGEIEISFINNLEVIQNGN